MANHPRLLCLLCLALFWGVALLGVWVRQRSNPSQPEDKDNTSLVVSATLTLLGLIIGFTFSMASTRYDQRRLFEENEANAIGTEYVRAAILPQPQAEATRALLRQYLENRLSFYRAGYDGDLIKVDSTTVSLQAQLWASILPQAAAAPNPVTALVVNGMNDVLNTQGYTQFAWWNRIPDTTWWLLVLIGLFANGLIGYTASRHQYKSLLLIVLPLLVSVSFFLIADIDSPRGGLIRIEPRNLTSLSQTMK